MIPISEQETVIQFNRDSSRCSIWTSDSTMMTKLDKLCKNSPKFYKLKEETKTQDGETAGKFYELTEKKMLSFRGTKREYTEEQKAIMAERMRNKIKGE